MAHLAAALSRLLVICRGPSWSRAAPAQPFPLQAGRCPSSRLACTGSRRTPHHLQVARARGGCDDVGPRAHLRHRQAAGQPVEAVSSGRCRKQRLGNRRGSRRAVVSPRRPSAGCRPGRVGRRHHAAPLQAGLGAAPARAAVCRQGARDMRGAQARAPRIAQGEGRRGARARRREASRRK